MRFSLMISRYLIGAVLPYFIFSWLLLSVILFVQQAARFGDIFFSANLPANLVWQLTLALVPNVVAFTAPMAALVGVIIGLSKMQSDNELVAIRPLRMSSPNRAADRRSARVCLVVYEVTGEACSSPAEPITCRSCPGR